MIATENDISEAIHLSRKMVDAYRDAGVLALEEETGIHWSEFFTTFLESQPWRKELPRTACPPSLAFSIAKQFELYCISQVGQIDDEDLVYMMSLPDPYDGNYDVAY